MNFIENIFIVPEIMYELCFILIIGIISHLIDIYFTYKLIIKAKDYYKNPEELEYNYHRWFMKKFGIKKGTIISGTISTLISSVLIIFSHYYYYPFSFFIVGMLFTVGYINYIHYFSQDDLEKKLILKGNKNERMAQKT